MVRSSPRTSGANPMSMVMPRSCSSLKRSVLTPVSALTSAVLPWSMWPAVPTTTCFMRVFDGGRWTSSPDAADLVELLFVVLAEEDVPLLAAFGDRPALLAHDLGSDPALDVLVFSQFGPQKVDQLEADLVAVPGESCLLYTSDAADERSSVDL